MESKLRINNISRNQTQNWFYILSSYIGIIQCERSRSRLRLASEDSTAGKLLFRCKWKEYYTRTIALRYFWKHLQN